jgi:hypothetical protein
VTESRQLSVSLGRLRVQMISSSEHDLPIGRNSGSIISIDRAQQGLVDPPIKPHGHQLAVHRLKDVVLALQDSFFIFFSGVRHRVLPFPLSQSRTGESPVMRLHEPIGA